MIGIRVGLVLAIALPASAQAQEYRRFELVDGRTLVGEVMETEATGFVVRLPQGTFRLPFGEMLDMLVATSADYEDQASWPVVVVSSADHRRGFVAALRGIDGLAIVGEDAGALPSPTETEVLACAGELACVREALRAVPGVWVVDARMDGNVALLDGALTAAGGADGARFPTSANRTDPDAVNRAVYGALGLEPPLGAAIAIAAAPEATPGGSGPEVAPDPGPADPGPADPRPGGDAAAPVATAPGATRGPDTTRTPPPPPIRSAWARDRVLAASFVPLPGFPSFAQGDAAGGALALAAVLPTTALWVGATGKNAQGVGEHVALAVGGYYVSTVLFNQVLGLRSLGGGTLAVGAAPAPDGTGLVIGLSGAN